MFSRIDIRKIVKAHFRTLRNINQKGTSYSDIFLFFIFPLVISSILIYYEVSIQSQISNLVTALSILAGFLFNLLAIIHTSLGKIKSRIKASKEELTSLKFKFANEIHSNISYNILIGLLSIIFLVIFGFEVKFKSTFCECIYNNFLNLICITLLIHFTLTLLMILNRIYILLDKEEE